MSQCYWLGAAKGRVSRPLVVRAVTNSADIDDSAGQKAVGSHFAIC